MKVFYCLIECKIMETFKTVIGWCNYEVSNIGTVRNKLRPNVVRKPIINNWGYVQLNLCKNSKYKCKLVHRLVGEAFIPNPENKPEINHKNGVKTDNRVENLEWVTVSENRQHAYDTGLEVTPRGKYSPSSKLLEEQVIEIKRLINSGMYKQKEIGNMFGIDQSHVSRLKTGSRKYWSNINEVNCEQ